MYIQQTSANAAESNFSFFLFSWRQMGETAAFEYYHDKRSTEILTGCDEISCAGESCIPLL